MSHDLSLYLTIEEAAKELELDIAKRPERPAQEFKT